MSAKLDSELQEIIEAMGPKRQLILLLRMTLRSLETFISQSDARDTALGWILIQKKIISTDEYRLAMEFGAEQIKRDEDAGDLFERFMTAVDKNLDQGSKTDERQ